MRFAISVVHSLNVYRKCRVSGGPHCLNCDLCDWVIAMIISLSLPVMCREQRSLFPTEARESFIPML